MSQHVDSTPVRSAEFIEDAETSAAARPASGSAALIANLTDALSRASEDDLMQALAGLSDDRLGSVHCFSSFESQERSFGSTFAKVSLRASQGDVTA
jgi:hypothetical protein